MPLTWPCLQDCSLPLFSLSIYFSLFSPSPASAPSPTSAPFFFFVIIDIAPLLLLIILLLPRRLAPAPLSLCCCYPLRPRPVSEVMFVPVCALVSAPLMNGVRGARRRPVPARPPPPRRAAGRPVVTSRGVSCELPLKCPWGLRR